MCLHCPGLSLSFFYCQPLPGTFVLEAGTAYKAHFHRTITTLSNLTLCTALVLEQFTFTFRRAQVLLKKVSYQSQSPHFALFISLPCLGYSFSKILSLLRVVDVLIPDGGSITSGTAIPNRAVLPR